MLVEEWKIMVPRIREILVDVKRNGQISDRTSSTCYTDSDVGPGGFDLRKGEIIF